MFKHLIPVYSVHFIHTSNPPLLKGSPPSKYDEEMLCGLNIWE